MQGTNSIVPGGADWAWVSSLPAALTTSPGPGLVTFAPEAGHTITLNAPFSGAGNLTLDGPGTLAIGAAHTYTGEYLPPSSRAHLGVRRDGRGTSCQ